MVEVKWYGHIEQCQYSQNIGEDKEKEQAISYNFFRHAVECRN